MSELPNAFYVACAPGRFSATAHTTGPWDPRAQHAGAPAALLGGAMEDAAGLPLVRVTLEVLRPVPVAELALSTAVERPGRRVTMVSGILEDDDGPCVIGRAWAIRRAPVVVGPVAPVDPPMPPLAQTPRLEMDFGTGIGWHTAMDLRFVRGGGFDDLGPAAVWSRLTVEVVQGRPLRPIERVLAIADAGNGASASADITQHLFINTELTVHLHRQPQGEWVGIDAHSVYEPDGVGMAFTSIHDATGPIGRGAQSLLLDRR